MFLSGEKCGKQEKMAKALGGKKAFRFLLIEEQINAIRKVQVLEIPYVE